MPDERLEFLKFESGGQNALVIGPTDPRLPAFISAFYQQVYLGDWDPDRVKELAQASTFSPKPIPVEFPLGRMELPEIEFDLVVVLWAGEYLGDPQDWLKLLGERLRNRGKLVMVSPADRPAMQNQQISIQALKLELEFHAWRGNPVQPGITADRLAGELQNFDFHFPRKPTYTDPDLLATGEFWREYATTVIGRIQAAKSPSRGSRSGREVLTDLKDRAGQLGALLDATEPATPPFTMVTGVKRHTRKSFLAALNDDNHRVIGENHTTDTYVSRSISETDSYERLLINGPGNLRNQDLMALALNGGVRVPETGFNPHKLAERIISEYGNAAIASERNPGRLAEMLGVPIETACQVVAIFELGRRFFREPSDREPIIRSPEDAFQHLRDMGLLRKEHLRGLHLNVQCRLIHDEVISIGILSRSVVHPREVFAPALEHAANSMILAHNHPSGDLTPSDTDIVITRQLAQAGRIMGIELLDHMIIGNGEFVSLKQKGVL